MVEFYEPPSKRRWLKDKGKAVMKSTKKFFEAVNASLPAISPGLYEAGGVGRL